jgi:predicted metal-dependent peptidase
MELTTLDRLRRARIQIQKSNPFFAYLVLQLKFKEAREGELPDYAGMGVAIDGTLVYKKEFVDKITEPELIGVLVHEILHLSLLHLTRRQKREPTIWNVAADICVNQIVKTNGYSLPRGAIVSDYNNNCEFMGVKINKCDKKTAEQVYEELEHLKSKMKKRFVLGYPSMNDKEGGGNEDGTPFDIHIEGKDEGNKNQNGKDEKDNNNQNKGNGFNSNLTEEEKREWEEFWKSKANEALVTAKLKGNVPAGIERLVGQLSEAKIGWREILQRYVQRAIPYDYTYSNPSKKSVATGYYMPNTIKDYIDVVVAVDTSGSIGQEELKEFLSEIVGIAKAFSTRVKMRLLTHDVKVWDDLLIQNGNIAKINELKVKGGGGTSHKEVLDYVNEKYKTTRLLICFTDGDSDLDEIDDGKYRFDKVFVISENGHDNQLRDFKAHIIKLRDFKYDN